MVIKIHKILLICLLTLYSTSLKGQVEYYIFFTDTLTYNTSFNLKLFKDNQYVFLCATLQSSNVLPLPKYVISRGTYKKIKNTIILYDTKWQNNMEFEYCKNGIMCTKGFLGLKNKTFTVLPDFSIIKNELKNKKSGNEIYEISNNIKELRRVNRINNTKYHTLYYGTYIDFERKIILMKPDKYQYYVGDFLLSEGTIKRIGTINELWLYDSSLNNPICFFIQENALVDNILYSESYLYRK